MLTVPEEVAAGAPFDVEVGRTGTQLGEDTGLTPATVVDLLRDGGLTLLLDDRPLPLDALTLPRAEDLAASGTARVTLTAPTGAGRHTVTVTAADERRLVTTTTRQLVVTAAEPTPGLTAGATAAPTTAPAAGVAAPTPGATATAVAERSEVLASGAPGGLLAVTGARVAGLAVAALALIAAGALVLRARAGRRTVDGR